MPQGRHRVAFSNKQKKEQLKAKRERKRNKNEEATSSTSEDQEAGTARTHKESFTDNLNKIVRKIHEQPTTSHPHTAAGQDEKQRNRYNLYFLRESKEDLDRLKKDASRKLVLQSDDSLEYDINDIYKPDSPLDIPRRPEWSYELSKDALDEHEKRYFKNYLEKIFANYDKNSLSYFEMNLETWRQLWRVLEISDIILFIVDARFPVLHFSPIFYNYVTNELKKECILIMNKADLIPPELLIAWKSYFKNRFHNLHIITFTSVPKARKNVKQLETDLKRKRQIYAIHSHHRLYECVRNLAKNTGVNLDSWNELITKHMQKIENNEDFITNETVQKHLEDDTPIDPVKQMGQINKNYITIGCCGFPNVGKSSLLNTLVGRKVVSVSRTPGHTKHLQTIFLTQNVRLCDCPGLVFPSLVQKPLQILSGIYPIAQLQEPYSVIRYLGEHIPIAEILKIKYPHEEEETEWNPLDICEAWALKRHYFTAKAARPDVYRAANEILRMALDGRLFIYLRPKSFSAEKGFWLSDKWQRHPETLELQEALQSFGFKSENDLKSHLDEEIEAEEEDEDDEEDEDEEQDETSQHESEDLKRNPDDASDEDNEEDDEDDGASNRYALLSKFEDD